VAPSSPPSPPPPPPPSPAAAAGVGPAAADAPPPPLPSPRPPALHHDELDDTGAAPVARDAASSAREDDPFAFGSAADLAYHRSNEQCWEHFDFGHLASWGATAALFCGGEGGAPDYARGLPASALGEEPAAQPSAAADAVAPAAGGSWLRCRVSVDAHLPPPTGPHTLCDGANVVLDTGRLSPTSCLASRPGYKCDGPPVHWAWGAGALAGACAPDAARFHAGAFPNDHLKDMFANRTAGAPLAAGELAGLPAADAPIVLLVARERDEHANAFHATTDLINAFMTLHAAGVIDGPGGARAGMAQVQVLLLDEQVGPFDEALWRRVFSPRHPLLRASELARGARARLRLPRALFVPPGYTNMLLSHVASEGDCHAGTQLLQSYRRFVLGGLGLLGELEREEGAAGAGGGARGGDGGGDGGSVGGSVGGGASPPVRVTLVSRRPYRSFVDHSFVGRQLENEEELLAAAGGLRGVNVTRADLAGMDAAAQVALIARTDVLVGMHGAALTHALYLPPHAGVLELWPKPADMWRCFEHIAAMSGLSYVRWASNAYPAGWRSDEQGDYTTVNAAEFAAMLIELVATTRARRDARHTPERAASAGPADGIAEGGGRGQVPPPDQPE